MKEYIQKLRAVEIDTFTVRAPNGWEMMEKIDEIIDYLNGAIEAGKMPQPK